MMDKTLWINHCQTIICGFQLQIESTNKIARTLTSILSRRDEENSILYFDTTQYMLNHSFDNRIVASLMAHKPSIQIGIIKRE